MAAYTAVLTVDMVFEWHRTLEDLKFTFDFWMPSDFVRAMEEGGPIACRWHADQIKEILPEEVEAALRHINRPGRFSEDGFIPESDLPTN
jgi:hypothetical protein